MNIRKIEPADDAEWLRMRLALWPEYSTAEHHGEMEELLSDPGYQVYVAERSEGRLGGFVEVSLRKYAEGCDSSPVGYIEGWYVDAHLRCQGIGGQLVKTAEDWVKNAGCQEIASDCTLENTISHNAHLALGYQEVERLIHFKKRL